MNWVCAQFNKEMTEPMVIHPGKMVMHIASLHAFVGDKSKITDRLNNL
jgi:hypothetical protein